MQASLDNVHRVSATVLAYTCKETEVWIGRILGDLGADKRAVPGILSTFLQLRVTYPGQVKLPHLLQTG